MHPKAGLGSFDDRSSPSGFLVVYDYPNPCWDRTTREFTEFISRMA
jgi:hypothetical protein